MKKAIVQRTQEGDDGTYSKLAAVDAVAGKSFAAYVAELPDRQGKRGLSRIPQGDYVVVWGQSPNRKNADGSPEWTFRLQNVPGHDGILIHSGNFAGDKLLGYATDVEGCLILGDSIVESIEISDSKRLHQPWISADRAAQKGVGNSKATVAAFVAFMGKDPFEISIRDIQA